MTRTNIAQLPKTVLANQQLHDGFESKAKAEKEDHKRIRQIDALIANIHLFPAFDCQKLTRLERRIAKKESLASAQYMRKQRKRVIPSLVEIAESSPDARFITVVPPTLHIPAGQLHSVDPKKLIARWRQLISRSLDGVGDGWLLAYIDGDYDALTRCFRVHFHGFASGSYLEAVDKIRHRRSMMCSRAGEGNSKVHQPVQIERQPITNVSATAGYVIKSFWSCKAIYEASPGVLKRGIRKLRIPEPQHTEVLLWLDRWSLPDVALLMGIRATSKGFVRNQSVHQSKSDRAGK